MYSKYKKDRVKDRAKGDGVGKGRGGVEARRLWGEYRRAVLGTSESVGINRQID